MIDWLLIGGYYGVSGAIRDRESTNLSNQIYRETAALNKKELESRIRELVWSADKKPELYTEIWEHIEEYKRDNPVYTISIDWMDVGKERLPFNIRSYFEKYPYKKSLTKTDWELMDRYKNQVVNLLMNTYDSMSFSAANKYVIAERKKNDAYFV